MVVLPPALAGLAAYSQFIVHRDKRPVSVWTGAGCDPTSPTSWCAAQTALDFVAAGAADGIGFVFTAHDPFWFIDIDHALQGNRWSDVAQDLMNRTAGAYIEVSRSGDGLHLIGSGALPEHKCRAKGGLELYHEGRFVALTGTHAQGDVRHDCSAVMAAIVAQYFPPGAGQSGHSAEWTDGPVPEWDGHTDDDELISHALRASGKVSAAAAFGGAAKATFWDLWHADADALGRAYPADGRAYDASSADRALAQHLAFWTGNDCARIERLMRQSALARDKWDSHPTYVQRTVLSACAVQTKWHKLTRTAVPLPPPDAVRHGELVAGARILTPPAQLDYFAGCVYVRDMHRIMIPDGVLLKSEQFNAVYGGFTFMLEATGDKSTRKAWEAFTESQAVIFPKVSRTMFRPDLPPGHIFEFGGERCVNNYAPAQLPRKEGDAGPFLRHLEKLIPDAQDRQILLAYMAACVQHQGVKFQWWPLIQGVEGNGKTLFSRCVQAAIGMRYTASPKADEVGNKFNSWIKDKTFVFMEDVYYSDARREVIEALKPIVTNDWLPVEPKGVDARLEYVVANGILNSNHRDAIQKTRNDRRYGVFYTAQQCADDIERDGMGGDYFPRLYNWLRADGYAIVAHYLATYPIPDELNPAMGWRAPTTSSTEQAILEGMGRVEQEIMEAVEQGQQGFAGGWISSMALSRLLDKLRAGTAIPLKRRREVLAELGYVPHPALPGGRANEYVPLDGGKPRLYIKRGHIHANLRNAAEVVRQYVKAQEAVVTATHWTVDAGVNKS